MRLTETNKPLKLVTLFFEKRQCKVIWLPMDLRLSLYVKKLHKFVVSEIWIRYPKSERFIIYN